MAKLSPTGKMLCATAAGLGTMFVAARMAPGHGASSDVVQPVSRAAPRPAAAPAPRWDAASAVAAGPASGAFTLGQRDRAIPSIGGDAFAGLNWQPPPPPPATAPPPPPPAAPPPPVAPPLPFAFVGMVENGAGKPQAFLSRGDTLLVVGVGDVIENSTYRIDSLAPSGVVLTYLPMGKQQTINIAGESK